MMQTALDIFGAIGGIGVIIIGFSRLFGGIARDRLSEIARKNTEKEIELLRQRLNVQRTQAEKFANSQYEIYVELWSHLQGLKMAVDLLWEKASENNIALLADRLRRVRLKINNWSLFFEDDHYRELNRLLGILENFEAGKTRLVQIRSSDQVHRTMKREVASQIEHNGQYREDFANLLNELRQEFQSKLFEIEQ